jgi:YHS domain-containing protein
MVRLIVFLLLVYFVARAIWRLAYGIAEGLNAPRDPKSPSAVALVRDPVCGTYVVPDRAVAITDGRRQVFFCSAVCRDKYRAQTG